MYICMYVYIYIYHIIITSLSRVSPVHQPRSTSSHLREEGHPEVQVCSVDGRGEQLMDAWKCEHVSCPFRGEVWSLSAWSQALARLESGGLQHLPAWIFQANQAWVEENLWCSEPVKQAMATPTIPGIKTMRIFCPLTCQCRFHGNLRKSRWLCRFLLQSCLATLQKMRKQKCH